MKKFVTYLATAGLLLGAFTPVQSRGPSAYRAAKIVQETFGEQALLNINNMAMWFERNGSSGYNPLTSGSGVTFPRSTDQVIYRDGLIWGGIVKDGDPQELRVGGQTYRIGTVPGRIISQGVAEDPADPSVRIYRIRRDYQTADLRLDASESLGIGLREVTNSDVEALRTQYEQDWREWPYQKGAPYYDNDGDGEYNPDTDEPGVAGADQVAWFVINDLDVGAAQTLYGSKPVGLEVQVLLWGYARTDALGDVIFKKFTVIYKGTSATPDTARIEDMYFAQWSDPDLGDYGDDFAGADIGLSLGYVYNSINDDSHYVPFGLAPPAVGYDFLQGPVVPVFQEDENGDPLLDEDGNLVLDENSEAIFNFGRRPGYRNLPMTSFVYFAAGSAIDDPELGEYIGTEEWYNLLRGFQPQPDIGNPVPYTNPLTGDDTFFTLDGDPTRATGWNDGVPLPAGDRRIVLNTGPFEMALGDTQEVVVALLGGISTDRLRSVSKLKFNDQFVQDAYNSFFEVPKPPAQPNVRVAELNQAILLDWGWDDESIQATEGEGSPGFEFEGYNLYQLPSAEATLSQGVKVATFDIENGVTTILGIALDEESGVVLDVPLQVGIDFGIKRNTTITQDHIRSGPLVNGQRYYFAVTAYNRATDEGAATTTLESTPQNLICVPQEPPPGTRYLSKPDSVITPEHTAGISEGEVEVVVVNPIFTTGHNYQVRFGADEEGHTVWSLIDETDGGKTLLADQFEIGPGDERAAIYLPDHGFELMVLGPPLALSGWEWEGSERWLTGINWGGSALGGGADVGPNFFGSSLGGADLNTVEIRFSRTNTQKGYRYLRGGDPNYGFQDFVDVPFTAWEVDSDPPRQVNIGFVENVGSTSENGTWDLASEDPDRGLGGREYLFIFDSDYSDTPLAQYGEGKSILADAVTFDIHAALWVTLRSGDHEMDMLEDGQILRLIPYRVNGPDDVFSFVVPGQEENAELLKEAIEKINVFPNPYLGVNAAETSRYSHFVTFSHLPSKANIRIFDMSGTLVRTIEKDDPSQFTRWDLQNHNALPVASGMYIAHIELPDHGESRILKLAIIQEQQFLENF
ncbi:MAG: T9SS type A sorting domain-containing protein [Gemmatimonadetes bacterium]|nr:T9SS type A sorting domain-containing protein [Gemmatimonadota bacterium]